MHSHAVGVARNTDADSPRRTPAPTEHRSTEGVRRVRRTPPTDVHAERGTEGDPRLLDTDTLLPLLIGSIVNDDVQVSRGSGHDSPQVS